MSNLNQEYSKLKLDYFRSLHNSSTKRGDIRAFIGVRSWLHEFENIKRGEDKYTAHIQALGVAIDELKGAVKRGSFGQVFKSSLKEWSEQGGLIQRETNGAPITQPPIPHIKKWKGNGMTQISLFSGAQGLDLGFLAAGFDLRFANDICPDSQKTITENVPSVPFVLGDFGKITTGEVLKTAGLDVGETDVLTGGPPCQPFSTAGKRLGFNDPRASPLKEFIRAIKEIQPKAFVMEEVTGLLSARLKHIPIAERDNKTLTCDEKKGSVFAVILKMLKSTGYKFTYGVLNAADFGAPQVRRRVVFIGLREGTPSLPEPTHSGTCFQDLYGRVLPPWNSFWDASIDLQGCEEPGHTTKLSENIKKYMRYIPPGGYWRHLPNEVVKDAMGGAYSSGGGKVGFYRRLAWDEPSPTVVTSPIQKGTMFCHPEAMRPLTVKEYKRAQGFPDDWEIQGSVSQKYKLIGDAVPVHLSYAIAKKVASLVKGEEVAAQQIYCRKSIESVV